MDTKNTINHFFLHHFTHACFCPKARILHFTTVTYLYTNEKLLITNSNPDVEAHSQQRRVLTLRDRHRPPSAAPAAGASAEPAAKADSTHRGTSVD